MIFLDSLVSQVAKCETRVYEDIKSDPSIDRKKFTEQVIQKIGTLTDQLESQIRAACPQVKEIYLEVEQEKKLYKEGAIPKPESVGQQID